MHSCTRQDSSGDKARQIKVPEHSRMGIVAKTFYFKIFNGHYFGDHSGAGKSLRLSYRRVKLLAFKGFPFVGVQAGQRNWINDLGCG